MGAFVLVAAVLAPTGLAIGGATQAALPCPVGELGPVCGAVDVVYSAACGNVSPELPTVGPLTVDIHGGAPVDCPAV